MDHGEYNLGKRGFAATCKDCERNCPICVEYGREFQGRSIVDSLNQLKMHRISHKPRTVVCQVCRSEEKKFRSGADAVLHVESGFCPGCMGRENAERQLYDFVRRQAPSLDKQSIND